MFRHIEGSKARCGELTLMIAHQFVEWHVVVVRSPSKLIQGDRQFSEDKARAHARLLAEQYLRDEEHSADVVPPELSWTPLESGDWMSWRP